MAITRQGLAELDAQVKALTRVYADHTRDLAAAWHAAWQALRPELSAVLVRVAEGGDTRAQMMRDVRVLQQMQAVFQSLETLAGNAAVEVGTSALPVLRESVRGTQRLLQASLPPGYPPPATMVDTAALRAMEQRVQQSITKAFDKLPPRTMLAIRSNLLTGVVQGDNPRTVARAMVSQAEDGFNLGLARAMTIARTEMLDAQRAGQQAEQLKHRDVLGGWVWVASLSNRTCRSCLAMHGQRFKVEDPGPIDHHQGRCARMPTTKTWKELGFTDIPEPPSVLPDAGDFFDGLSEDEQRAMLGRQGFEKWQAGEWPRERWATRKKNPGWRDSMVPARP